MSLIEIKGPELPESEANAEFQGWLVEVNQQVSLNQEIAVIEAAKTSFSVVAPMDGFITEVLLKKGDTYTSGQVLARFQASEAPAKAAPAPVAEPVAAPAETVAEAPKAPASPVAEPALVAPAAPAAKTAEPAVVKPASKAVAPAAKLENDFSVAARETNLGPKARRLIQEHGISSDEVEQYLKHRLPPRVIAAEIKAKKYAGVDTATKTRVPMTNIRKHIAQRLLESKNSTAMLTTFNEVDLSRVMEVRKTYGEAFTKKHNIRLGFMSFFVKAVSEAMKEFPIISACIEGDDIVYSNATDISIAVSTERGLVTPVLRHAEVKSLADIEREIAAFAEKANKNKLTIEDMTGGNFTITNGGVFGSLFSTPIINPPQSAILGMHGIKKRPVVVDDQIVIRPMMYIALSYDHRLIDGKDSVRFLAKVKQLLEDPVVMLLDL